MLASKTGLRFKKLLVSLLAKNSTHVYKYIHTYVYMYEYTETYIRAYTHIHVYIVV